MLKALLVLQELLEQLEVQVQLGLLVKVVRVLQSLILLMLINYPQVVRHHLQVLGVIRHSHLQQHNSYGLEP